MGGASIAGIFLKEFVGSKDYIPKWCHIDIAGTAFIEKPQKEFISGATGAGVRTLLNYLKKLNQEGGEISLRLLTFIEILQPQDFFLLFPRYNLKLLDHKNLKKWLGILPLPYGLNLQT